MGGVVNCRVLPDETENTSDHLPLYVEINMNHCRPIINVRPKVTRTSWEKVVKQGVEHVYTNHLENMLGRYLINGYLTSAPCTWSRDDIEARVEIRSRS